MLTHPLGGKNTTLARVRQELAKGPEHIRRLYMDKLFPADKPALKERALKMAFYAVFAREWQALPPSLGFINPEKNLLVTDENLFQELDAEQQAAFFPAIVLESRSHRARFWVDEQGACLEFKGLTPREFDEERINSNSNDPQGLFTLSKARREAEGLRLIGELDPGVVELGEYFPDLGKYGQLCRRAQPGGKYFPWARMDLVPAVMETLAELEGIPFETYLYEAGERFGRQLKVLHDAGLTLHTPFRQGTQPAEPFFSSLHSGNVEVHGQIIDLEGTRTFAEAEALFQGGPGPDRKSEKIEPKVQQGMTERPFALFSRLADLQRFIGGRWSGEGSLFAALHEKNPHKETGVFMRALAGLIDGYYGAQLDVPGVRSEVTEGLEKLGQLIAGKKIRFFSYYLAYQLFTGIEDEISVRQTAPR